MAERAASRAFLKTEMAESQEATAAAIKAEAIAERAERVASQANFDHQAIANKTKSGFPTAADKKRLAEMEAAKHMKEAEARRLRSDANLARAKADKEAGGDSRSSSRPMSRGGSAVGSVAQSTTASRPVSRGSLAGVEEKFGL